jgi:RHS repeat-associated protein
MTRPEINRNSHFSSPIASSNLLILRQDVYFDDLKVTHAKSPVVQADDYYPFGLTSNSYQQENSVTNDFLYNRKERQEELGLGWLDYGARMYMPEIGRWHVIDPLTDFFQEWSPYTYAYNNPIRFTDPFGMANEDQTNPDPNNEPNSLSP